MEGTKMQCPECQFENREGVKFCEDCGAKFELECPACKANIPLGRKFCGDCGYNLTPTKKISGEKSEAESLPSSPSTKKSSSDVAPLEGERKHVTVLFSDLTGYTVMSEKLDPEEVKEITSRIFGEISKTVDKYDGFIEKYAGDAVMALFGVPRAHEDDPIRAVKAAREIHELVDAVSPEVENRIGQPISMHTGINTGLVVTGEVDLERGTHGVAGDTINLASRLSNLAKPGEILIDVDTCRQVEGHFTCEYLEETTVKGKIKYYLKGTNPLPYIGSPV
jgi:class 3 adenylate cyclase